MQIAIRSNPRDGELSTSQYIVESKEVQQAAQILVGRILNLVERNEGRTPDPKEVSKLAAQLVKDAA